MEDGTADMRAGEGNNAREEPGFHAGRWWS
jgi:hypothetical protein